MWDHWECLRRWCGRRELQVGEKGRGRAGGRRGQERWRSRGQRAKRGRGERSREGGQQEGTRGGGKGGGQQEGARGRGEGGGGGGGRQGEGEGRERRGSRGQKAERARGESSEGGGQQEGATGQGSWGKKGARKGAGSKKLNGMGTAGEADGGAGYGHLGRGRPLTSRSGGGGVSLRFAAGSVVAKRGDRETLEVPVGCFQQQ